MRNPYEKNIAVNAVKETIYLAFISLIQIGTKLKEAYNSGRKIQTPYQMFEFSKSHGDDLIKKAQD
jgi:hypothetical protein